MPPHGDDVYHRYERMQQYTGFGMTAVGLVLVVASVAVSDRPTRALVTGAIAAVVVAALFRLIALVTTKLDRVERVADARVAPTRETAQRAVVTLAVGGALFVVLSVVLISDGGDAPVFPWIALAFAADRLLDARRARRWEDAHDAILVVAPGVQWFRARPLLAVSRQGPAPAARPDRTIPTNP